MDEQGPLEALSRLLSYSYAIVHDDPPALFVAEDLEVLHRVLALSVVAQTPGSRFRSRAPAVREALLQERWADAVVAWMEVTGIVMDVYQDGLEVRTSEDVAGELAGLQLQFTPLFEQ